MQWVLATWNAESTSFAEETAGRFISGIVWSNSCASEREQRPTRTDFQMILPISAQNRSGTTISISARLQESSSVRASAASGSPSNGGNHLIETLASTTKTFIRQYYLERSSRSISSVDGKSPIGRLKDERS